MSAAPFPLSLSVPLCPVPWGVWRCRALSVRSPRTPPCAPSQVQKACIPKALEGMDIVGQAKTGTGKTLAYLVPMAHALLTEGLEDGGLHSLVIVPSREISRQVELVAKKLFTFEKGVRVKRLAGGTWRRQDVPRVNSEDAGSSGKVFDPKHSHITKDYEVF